MDDQLISFKTARLAKEKGFEEFVYYCYLEDGELYGTYSLMDEDDSAFIDIMDGNELENHNSSIFDRYSAPTQSLLQKWLREIHNIAVVVHVDDNIENNVYYIHTCIKRVFSNRICSLPKYYKTYEEALEKGLYEALKLI